MRKHALSTRLWHWLNALSLVVLFMSGLNISNAHRHLYWGQWGFSPRDAWLDVGINWEAMQVNAATPVEMAQAYLLQARSNAGRRVIQVTDQKLANPNPDFFSYTMSKHALAATVPMLALASAPEDRIYALAPGAILPSHDQEADEAEVSHRMNLLERRTTPEEVAEAAWFLSTGPLASGQTLFVDSGQHLLAQPRDVMYLARP